MENTYTLEGFVSDATSFLELTDSLFVQPYLLDTLATSDDATGFLDGGEIVTFDIALPPDSAALDVDPDDLPFVILPSEDGDSASILFDGDDTPVTLPVDDSMGTIDFDDMDYVILPLEEGDGATLAADSAALDVDLDDMPFVILPTEEGDGATILFDGDEAPVTLPVDDSMGTIDLDDLEMSFTVEESDLVTISDVELGDFANLVLPQLPADLVFEGDLIFG